MRCTTRWLAALLPALAGCPLPQALPETIAAAGAYGPRIPFELVSPQDTFIEVGTACASQPRFSLAVTVTDRDQQEAVEARWFIDYDPAVGALARPPDSLVGNGQDYLRPVPAYVYRLPDWQAGAAREAHVVEIVVSNGGFKTPAPSDPLPNRMPATGYDTQSFRWIFRYAASGACPCDAGACP